MILKPLLQNGYIPRTPVKFSFYDEDSSVKIITSLTQDHVTKDMTVVFRTVANINITALYFPEYYYGEYEIIDNGNECGFFERLDSNIDISIFDPNNRLNLKSFLIFGYDSYIEVLSSDFEIKIID